MILPLRVFLVDDEAVALRRLARLLEATGRVQIVGSTTDPERAVATLREMPVDALFLDIQMPGLNGFELLQRLASCPPVVFTTAYDEYALRAFEVYAIDYLLKPIEAAQLERTLARLERLHGQTASAAEIAARQTELQTVLAKLAEALNASKSGYLQRLASRTGGHAQIIDVAAITHFYAQDKLTFAATAAREQGYVVDYTITELEQRVDPQGFVRIHRSVLLNIDYIDEVHGWFAGRVMVRLKDARRTELVVARDRVRVLKEVLGL